VKKKFYTWHDKTLVLDPGYFAWYSPVPAWLNHPATLEHPFGDVDDEYVPQVVDEPDPIEEGLRHAEKLAVEAEMAAQEVAVDAQQTAAQVAEQTRTEIKTRPLTWVALGFLGGVLFTRWRRSRT
jgi:hypothetical protein